MLNTLRRRGLSSDADMHRRHSEFLTPNSDVIAEGRASEQIPRKSSSANITSPAGVATMPAPSNPSSPLPAIERSSSPPPIHQESPRHRRFSMMRFRNASDPQLSARAKLEASETPPPLPKPPEIIKTAPTLDVKARPTKKKSRMRLPGRTKTSTDSSNSGPFGPLLEDLSVAEKKERRKTLSEGAAKSRVTFDQPERPVTQGRTTTAPPAYGDESVSSLALPVNRLSESSRSDGSSGDHTDHGVYASTTTTTHIVHTTTTIFRLPRRKKPGPLFPLPARVNATESSASSRPSFTNSRPPTSPHGEDSAAVKALRPLPSGEDLGLPTPQPSPSRNLVQNTLARTSMTFAAPGAPLIRNDSKDSTPSSPTRRRRTGLRDRSSTIDSASSAIEDPLPVPGLPSASTRTSTSTGRKSFGDLFGLSARLRQNSEPPHPKHSSGPATPVSSASKGNSMQLPREPLVIPERLDDDTPAKYLVRLEEAVSRGVVASILSKGSDPFSQQVLRSYMRGFAFFGDPLDMAIRKLLMEVELPKETQHIDRCLQGFANRYHECNAGIFENAEQAYFIAFSLLILHTDAHNKNNKHKMSKADYLKNIRDEGISDAILECFYDNISYWPFLHVEDDIDINGERIVQHKMKKKSMIFPRVSPESSRKNLKDLDPYELIISGKLETIRPNLKDVMDVEEHYSYLGTATSLDLHNLQKTFFKTGILQIMSLRSRPDAFLSERTVTNPEDAHPGVVDIKITKVGLLWRKDAKKKKTRSPWQEWGAILTGAQLYFFRNTAWIKSLMQQQQNHEKQGHDGTPVIFHPPLQNFKPDALMSTDDSVALLDSSYNKHKNAFVFVRHGGFEEIFLADNQDEMNDWLAKLNYAAAFRTSGVRMRSVVGGNHDGQRSRGIRRLEPSAGLDRPGSTHTVQTPTGEVTIVSGRIDSQMAQDILTARREIMMQKISDSEEKLRAAQKQLDVHLRNARHLQILAPMQARTRDQVLLAAGRMAAKLKWLRLEMWRLRCHKDILTMDLEEEDKLLRSDGVQTKGTPVDRPTTMQTEKQAIGIATPQGSPLSASDSTQPSRPPTQSATLENEHRPEMPQHTSSFQKQASSSWELPHFPFDNRTRQKSISSSHSLGAGSSVGHRPSHASIYPPEKPLPSTPPQIDAAEQEILQQAGLDIENTPESKLRRPETPTNKLDTDESKDQLDTPGGGTEKSRDKIRRSLHRTLRDAQNHVPGATHHRSRKGRESSSSVGISNEENNEDALARGKGSFVLHGKKASVITFGTELQSMSAEERLRLRQVNREVSGVSPGAKLEDDFHSVLIEPVEFRRGSVGSGSTDTGTGTAGSFGDLRRRLSALAGEEGGDGGSDRESVRESASSSLLIPKLRVAGGGGVVRGESGNEASSPESMAFSQANSSLGGARGGGSREERTFSLSRTNSQQEVEAAAVAVVNSGVDVAMKEKLGEEHSHPVEETVGA